MPKPSDSSNSPKISRAPAYRKPFDVITGFFHPISKKEVQDVLKKSNEVSAKVDKTIEEAEKLHQKIDQTPSLK